MGVAASALHLKKPQVWLIILPVLLVLPVAGKLCPPVGRQPKDTGHSSINGITVGKMRDTFPDSRLLRTTSIKFYDSSRMSFASGSDLWPLTWGKNGAVYGAWGDGWGWKKSENESKGFMGITLIKGIPPNVQGTDVWQEVHVNRKPLALVACRDVLYLFYDLKKDHWNGTYLSVSGDQGKTWRFNDKDPLFTLSVNDMKIVGVAQFGPGYTDLPENVDAHYFYLYLSDRTDGKKTDGKDIWLARVKPEDVFQKKAYEFFTGMHLGQPVWSSDEQERVPVLHDDRGMGYLINVSFNMPRRRFLLTKSSQINHLGIWYGLAPWGPWINIYKNRFLDGHWKFSYVISPKWISEDGHRLWMTFSGWPEEDRINFIRAELKD